MRVDPRCVLLISILILALPASADAQTGTTTRVSVATGGGQGDGLSMLPALSADGRYVAFMSGATNLVPNDTNGTEDVFVHDRQTGMTMRVSISSGGGEANDLSRFPAVSADGRYVAFESWASNLVAGDANAMPDVFVHDGQSGTTTRVSVATGGGQAVGGCGGPYCPGNWAQPKLSADGRYVAFTSWATNLVPGDTNGMPDVFVHDQHTGTTTRVSLPSGGGQADGASGSAALSADGQFVAFESWATNLVPGDTNGVSDVFVHDRQTGTTTRVSIPSGGGQANDSCRAPAISVDGRYVAFTCDASNLVPNDTEGWQDVFVHDRQTGTTTRVSIAMDGGEADSGSGEVALSADGRFVAFESGATNLVPGDTNGTIDVFVHDRQTGTTTRVSVGTGGTQASGARYGGASALSADGRHVAFDSDAANLVPGDTNAALDVFVHEGSRLARAHLPAGDYDGDGTADPTVFRPSTGTWYELRSSTASGHGTGWGVAGDIPVPADYDGDGQTDAAVFRPSTGTWYVVQSATGTGLGVQWGVAADVPVPADYDGDGKIDVAVWRPSTGVWYIIRSAANTAVGVTWGTTGDTPVPADFDGDGKADPTVFRASAGTWYQLRSTTGEGYGVLWGTVGDVPLAGDYDGDGKADPTVFRASTGTWYELRSTTGTGYGVLWGTIDDVPIVGDYDGDGKMDPTVFRPSTNTWYQLRSTTGTGYGVVWGASGDLPQ